MHVVLEVRLGQIKRNDYLPDDPLLIYVEDQPRIKFTSRLSSRRNNPVGKIVFALRIQIAT